ncbi:alpha/beta hydrolase [Gordonia alkaliphila]|uniref:alpha/beta fold hydrolase n=1 Tax=Gordonia alkaliphila TaxID=1053547 RepID=UPI001FF1ADCA|nr:alpha/beta hydrolase [Gordonia alkaliphila]MCK0440371.1 alpha/beta hydrolase [Gordonia alkaliphila]
MESEHLKVEHDGLVFDVHRSGPPRGPWVVLLHGFPVNSSCYDAVLPRVHDAGLRTLTIDQRGYSPGARPEAVEDYRLDTLVDDVLGVLGHLNIAYSMLVGHDWGGIVAWHLAAKHPEHFTGLVAISTGHPSAMAAALAEGDDQRTRSAYIKNFVADGAEAVLSARNGVMLRRAGVHADELGPILAPDGLRGPLNWYRANFTGDIAKTLACPPVEVPTTMLWSDADAALGREQAEMSGRFVYSDFRFSELAGVDHWVPQRTPEAVASEIALRSAQF